MKVYVVLDLVDFNLVGIYSNLSMTKENAVDFSRTHWDCAIYDWEVDAENQDTMNANDYLYLYKKGKEKSKEDVTDG